MSRSRKPAGRWPNVPRRSPTSTSPSKSITTVSSALSEFRPSSPTPTSREQLDRLTNDIGSSLGHYPDRRQPEEEAFLGVIHDLFERHRQLYRSAVGMPLGMNSQLEQLAMSNQILLMRSQLLDWSGRLTAWNLKQIHDSDEALLTQFGKLQASLSGSLSIVLGAGVILVIASMIYILRLERQTRRRYRELAQSRYELEQLSSRLVDAQEDERRSISRELHDEVGQTLGALLVDLGRLSSNLPNDSQQIRERLEHMKSMAEGTVRTVRDMALLLRPSMLDDLGLVAALEWQGREVSRRSEMEVKVESENVSDDLPDEYKICVYRLVQEALNNAVRHSKARNARVRVRSGEAGIAVEVTDDGSGFDPERTRGLGILGMEERVKRLGGTLQVISNSGQGTTVKADLPVPVPAGVAV